MLRKSIKLEILLCVRLLGEWSGRGSPYGVCDDTKRTASAVPGVSEPVASAQAYPHTRTRYAACLANFIAAQRSNPSPNIGPGGVHYQAIQNVEISNPSGLSPSDTLDLIMRHVPTAQPRKNLQPCCRSSL